MTKANKNNKSFTLIELLIITVIMGFIATITTVVTNPSQNTALLKELSNLAQALQEKESYPVGSFCIEDKNNKDAKRFKAELKLEKIPKHPKYDYTKEDGNAHLNTNNCFLYFSDGKHYSIRLPALENKGYLIQESRHPEVKAIQEECEEGWIPFRNRCVMQYEAKYINNRVTSDAKTSPWTLLTQDYAKEACEEINAHLMTNAEWMALARDIEAQDENWVGSVLKRGNNGINAPDGSSYDGPNPDCEGLTKSLNFGTNRDPTSPAKLILSNGQEIWDFSGNTSEWIDHTIAKDNLPPVAGQVEFSDAVFHDLYFPESEILPLKATSSTLGGGKIYYDNDKNKNDPRAFIRGGDWDDGARAGVFFLYLSYGPKNGDLGLGFRCVR